MAKQFVRLFSVVIILSILLAQFGLSPVAAAANFVVDSNADKADADPGDGLCQTTEGECTLRAAIQEANGLEGADSISIPAGTYTLTLEGSGEDAAASGDLDISDSLTIRGAGMGSTLIDANGLDRAFQVQVWNFELSDLTVQNGLASPGGAILVNGHATISRVEFRENQSTSSESTGTGGAIHITVEASADITQSQFIGNFAHYGGGAVSNTYASTFSITDSTFDSNSSTLGGGALYSNGNSTTVENSTFLNNSADTGGAIHSNANSVDVNNSTFVGNSAVNHGAIDARVGTITVNNSTFSGNSASGLGDTLGDQPEQGGDLQVGNSILSGTGFNNCGGSVVDLGNNLSWPVENNCPGTSTDPRLDSLADNGGETETVALLADSPAIDAGDNRTCTPTDQRGVTRPQGDACDIGAFEVALINLFSVTNSSNGPDEIHFNIPSESINTISPASALPTIIEPVVIDAYTQPGANPNTSTVGNN